MCSFNTAGLYKTILVSKLVKMSISGVEHRDVEIFFYVYFFYYKLSSLTLSLLIL